MRYIVVLMHVFLSTVEAKEAPPLWVHGLSAMIDVCVTHPLWVSKTLTQQGKEISLRPRDIPSALFYRGLASHLVLQVPVALGRNSLLENETLEGFLAAHVSEEVVPEVQAFVSGSLTALYSNPIELIRTQQVYLQRLYQEEQPALKALAEIYRGAGAGACLKGVPAVMLRDGIVTWGAQKWLPLLRSSFNEMDEPLLRHMQTPLSIGVTSLALVLLTQPIDTVKSVQHWQLVHGFDRSLAPVEVAKASSAQAALRLCVQRGGFRALWSGFTTRSSRLFLGLWIRQVSLDQFDHFQETQG